MKTQISEIIYRGILQPAVETLNAVNGRPYVVTTSCLVDRVLNYSIDIARPVGEDEHTVQVTMIMEVRIDEGNRKVSMTFETNTGRINADPDELLPLQPLLSGYNEAFGLFLRIGEVTHRIYQDMYRLADELHANIPLLEAFLFEQPQSENA
mgnify:CR=1 FL=1